MRNMITSRRMRLAPANALQTKGHPFAGRMSFVLSVLFLRLALDAAYVLYVAPVFGNHFLVPLELEFDWGRYFSSFLLVVVPTTFLPYGKENLSGLFFCIPLVFLYIPMTTIYGLDLGRTSLGVFLCLSALVVAYFVAKVRICGARLAVAKKGKGIVILLGALVLVYFYVWSVITGAVNYINFDLLKIYEFRGVASELMNVGPLSYLNLLAAKVFNPFVLALGFMRRSYILICIGLLNQIYYFATTQHRMHLFVPLLVLFVWLLYRDKSYMSLPQFYGFVGGGVVAVLGFSLFLQLDVLPAIILRRAFFVPAGVAFSWVEYFVDKPKVLFADRFLSTVSVSVYAGENLPHFLGYVLSGRNEIAFNAGLVGAGYAQAGFFGVVAYACVLGVVLKCVNALLKSGVPKLLAASLLFAPLRTAWADSDLLTTLVSHGVVVSLCLLWLYGRHSCGPSIR